MRVAMGLPACAVEHTWTDPFRLHPSWLSKLWSFKGIVSKPGINFVNTLVLTNGAMSTGLICLFLKEICDEQRDESAGR